MPATVGVRQSSVSTTGYLDGLGRRSIRFDRELGATLECLHVRPELRAYEDALLAQACAMSELADPNVVRIRSLEREHGRLVVISELPRGNRLSDVFDSRPAGATSSVDATFGFLLSILPTLANLHAASIVHGAIAPGRVMVEGKGRIVLADAIFGTALPRLNLSRQRLWHELEIAFAPEEGTEGTGADVAQAALCGIAVALGRELDADDPRQAVPSMIDHLAQLAHARGGEQLSTSVRSLFRALLPVYGAASEATAAQACDRIREIAARDLDESACAAAFVEFIRYDAPATVIATFDESRETPTSTDAEAVATEPNEVPLLTHVIPMAQPTAEPVTEKESTPIRTLLGVTDGDAIGHAQHLPLPFVARARAMLGSMPFPWKLAAAAVLVIGVVFFAGVPSSFTQADESPAKTPNTSTPAKTESAPPAGSPSAVKGPVGLLTVTTDPAGAKILLDGVEAGQTPLRLDSVAPGRHTVTMMAGSVTPKRTVKIEAGKSTAVSFPPPLGWVTIKSPVKLELVEDGRRLGTSDQRRIQLAAGRHEITFSNRAAGYSVVKTIDVSAGSEAVVSVTPTGRVNLNAQPWAEVWIDGSRAGETPIANLEVPLGPREFVFKHPQYGERKLSATVSTNPTALTVDFTKPAQLR
jgi:hypothetical protein